MVLDTKKTGRKRKAKRVVNSKTKKNGFTKSRHVHHVKFKIFRESPN